MEENKGMDLAISQEIAHGKYTNLALITHSADEFIFDFAEMVPGIPKPEVISRLIMNPKHAKQFLQALSDNISKYESHFGTIKRDNPQQGLTFNMGDFNHGKQS
ncbi:MAG: DUF3467 domain-containing protein [Bacteroidales bacterium]|nr:DUF3467 domain-containing protein [Bacteroidales bacterium]